MDVPNLHADIAKSRTKNHDSPGEVQKVSCRNDSPTKPAHGAKPLMPRPLPATPSITSRPNARTYAQEVPHGDLLDQPEPAIRRGGMIPYSLNIPSGVPQGLPLPPLASIIPQYSLPRIAQLTTGLRSYSTPAYNIGGATAVNLPAIPLPSVPVQQPVSSYRLKYDPARDNNPQAGREGVTSNPLAAPLKPDPQPNLRAPREGHAGDGHSGRSEEIIKSRKGKRINDLNGTTGSFLCSFCSKPFSRQCDLKYAIASLLAPQAQSSNLTSPNIIASTPTTIPSSEGASSARQAEPRPKISTAICGHAIRTRPAT